MAGEQFDEHHDEQSEDQTQDPKQKAQEPDPPVQGNRPADNARVVSVSDSANEANVWASGDEATDFLGLNSELEDPTSGRAVGAADLPDTKSWLLEHVEGNTPQASPNPTGPPEESWLLDHPTAGEVPGGPMPPPVEPAQVPLENASPRSVPEQAFSAHAQRDEENWLLDSPDEGFGAGGLGGAAGLRNPGEASFVEDGSKNTRKVRRLGLQGLGAAALVVGCWSAWHMMMSSDSLGEPVVSEGIERRTGVQHDVELADPGAAPDPTPSSEGESGPRTTVPGSQGSEPELPAWREALQNRSTSTTGELDTDIPPGGEVSPELAQGMLDHFADLVTDFESGDLAKVPYSELAQEGDWVDPFAGFVDPASATLLATRMDLDSDLVPSSRSVLDQYLLSRLSGEVPEGERFVFRVPIGVESSQAPTLENPFLVATVGQGAGWNVAEIAPEPEPFQDPVAALTGPVTDAVPVVEIPGPDPLTSEDPNAVAQLSDPLEGLTDPASSDPVSSDPENEGLVAQRSTRLSMEDMELQDENDGSFKSSLRSADPYTKDHWFGQSVPMQKLDRSTRTLTPRVGAVRVVFHNGEVFEGNLFGLGKGGIWLDQMDGRLHLESNGLARIERIETEPNESVAGRDLRGLPKVRVRSAGGVFEGHQVDREGDRVTLITAEGYRITLESNDVQPARTKRPRIGIRRQTP